MSGKKKTVFDSDPSTERDDLPKYVETKSVEPRDTIPPSDESLDLVGGEKIQPDIHTLVRNYDKKNLDRTGISRDSLVGMKEGVPGTYSGFQRAEKSYSKLDRKGSDSSLRDDSSPTRPPRKGRFKSDSSLGADYDHLWTPRKGESDSEDHVYSLLGSDQSSRLYDDVEENNSNVIIRNSSPLTEGGWVENGKRLYSPDDRMRNRPMSTVVLPISPVEGAPESDNESDWGSDFDESVHDDQYDNDGELYEIIGDMSKSTTSNRNSVYQDLNAVRARTAQVLKTSAFIANKPLPPLPDKPLPPLPDESSSLNETDDEIVPYVDIIYDGENHPHPVLPPIGELATENEIKRYQIIKYILENEHMYSTTLSNLIQDYEKPLKFNRIINQESVKVIFQHLQEIEQCHKLFNIALAGRMAEWDVNPNIGDIIYASFSKSMVLKAYTSYVRNFITAMERVKDTCKAVPAFLTFLRNRLRKSFHKYSFYDLLKRPLGRFPQLVVLLQELLKVTPICHSDRLPLQMALTHLECLSELICDKRRDMEMKYKVAELDKYFAGLNKPLFSNTRYYIRHDDMLLCKVVDGRVVKTKHRRIFLLSDLLICASIINKSSASNILSSKRYKVRWCVPVLEVDVMDVGSGIMVNIDNKSTTTIRYTHPVSSPRPGAVNVEERLEDFQHDLAVIGQIAGLVASLRQSYEVTNEAKVSDWYRDVKETFEKETELANMHWLELCIPAKDKKTTTCLFNLHPPQKKTEWTAELENAKLRIAFDNNPGWFIIEDESVNVGNMGLLRRNLPLLANKVPLIMVESKHTIERVLEVTPHGSSKPVLWIFSGTDHSGHITLMEMSMSSVPHVIESFSACEARILAAEVVKDESNRFADPSEQEIFIWCGTMSGRIHIFNASPECEHEEVASTKLKDSVLCFKHVSGKVFAGIANGVIVCFRRKIDRSWDLENPITVCLSKLAVMDLTEARGKLWCASGNYIHVLDIETLGTERKIKVGNNNKFPVKHLVSYGSGVWASQWKSPTLHLYHNETFECLQSLSVATPLIRMKNDIDTRVQGINIEKTYVTSMLARGGLLWVGTDNGVIITYPLPRLGGVPQVSGKPCVSFHGHEGAVRCLHAFRVERSLRNCKLDNIAGSNAIARSLFYIDPFDQAASGLNVPSLFPELAVPMTMQAESPSEPYYFALEPEAARVNESEPTYAEYLKSLDGASKRVDPMLSPDSMELLQSRQESYNSDESMDSDTEFSFIEDNAKKVPQRAKKNAASFSVNIWNGADKSSQGTVRANNLPGGMPSICETEFADMLGSFEGFDVEKSEKDRKGDNEEKSASETDFVVLGKTNSGYEDPIPPTDHIVAVTYATVSKNKSAIGNGTLKNSTPTLIEVVRNKSVKSGEPVASEFDEQEDGEPVKPSDELVEKYKSEPLPEVPTKTLYERSIDWDRSLEEGYENCKNTVPTDDVTSDVENGNVAMEKGMRGEEKRGDRGEGNGMEEGLEDRGNGCGPEIEEYGNTDGEKHEEETENHSGKMQAERTMNEVDENSSDSQSHTKRTGNDQACQTPLSVDQVPSLEMQNSEEAELEFGDIKEGKMGDQDLKSPLFVKVTDPVTHASIEGHVEAGAGLPMSRGERLKSFSGETKREEVNPHRRRSETMPVTAGTNDQSPWSSKTTQVNNREDDMTVSNKPDTIQRSYSENLDLSLARRIEHKESIYTPLLNQSRESMGSSLSGIGAGSFDNEMAISNSMAREKIARQSQQGTYASLISVSNGDNKSRIDSLMQPMYVVSVGSGYLDLRRKQKIGSGLDFFTKLKASEPSPKLLIWKVTS